MIDVMIITGAVLLLWAARQLFFLYRHRRYIRRLKQLEAEIEHLPPTLSLSRSHIVNMKR